MLPTPGPEVGPYSTHPTCHCIWTWWELGNNMGDNEHHGISRNMMKENKMCVVTLKKSKSSPLVR